MEVFRIRGGVPLHGAAAVAGSKNAALPILAATILARGPLTLRNVPRLTDVAALVELLEQLGVAVDADRDGAGRCLRVRTIDPLPSFSHHEPARRIRATFCTLGPLLARRGHAVVPLPGGCRIGRRPVDLHLKGLAALGAEIRIEQGHVIARAKRLIGARVSLAGPSGPTVTGTANVLAAATLARGRTTLLDAAREPEIVDLGRFLIAMGARIEGLGTSTLHIAGVEQLAGCDYCVTADRIEAATLLVAAMITRGSINLTNVVPEHLAAVLELLAEAGARIDLGPDWLRLIAPQVVRPIRVLARPYPGLPTDVQPQLTALAALADGDSNIRDEVFPQRFAHLRELARLGADVRGGAGEAAVRGVRRLHGARVAATDLRGGAALVLAALAAEGTTTVRRIDHLDRGYERFERKLRGLGARIERLAEVPAVGGVQWPVSAPQPEAVAARNA